MVEVLSQPTEAGVGSTGRGTPSPDMLATFSEDALPVRPSTAPESQIEVEVEDLGRALKLAVDASPGCGGITWAAGEVGRPW